MKRAKLVSRLAVVILVFGPLLARTPAQSSALALQAVAGRLNHVGAAPTIVHITIDRWSTEDVRQRLFDTVKSPQVASDTLKRQERMGDIRTLDYRPGQSFLHASAEQWAFNLDFTYAESSSRQDGGRDVLLLTVREIKFAKGSQEERVALESPFTAIELSLGRDQKGRGKIYQAARIRSIGARGFVFDSLAAPLELGDVKPR